MFVAVEHGDAAKATGQGLLAQPLPVPKDPAAFKQFRELNLKFRPNE